MKITNMLRKISLAIGLCVAAVSANAQTLFTASLDGAQCVPAVTTGATGTAWLVLDADMSTLDYRITLADLTNATTQPTSAHIHLGAAGTNGGVFQALTFVDNQASGTITGIEDTMMLKLFKGEMYINIHTVFSPSGEIRGQILHAEELGFTINVDTAQAHPTTASGGHGTGYAWFNDGGTALNYQVTMTGAFTGFPTAAHLHYGAAGASGGVAHTISFTGSTVSGVWTGLTPADAAAIMKNGIYVNVHTTANPNGEVRGQLERVGNVMFGAGLFGALQVPSVTTTGNAAFHGVLNPDQAYMDYSMTYAQTSSAVSAMHFHYGVAGSNGGVAAAIPHAGNFNEGTWSGIADTVMGRLLQESIYINVHTTNNPSGEIRGQVKNYGGAFFTIDLDGDQAGVTTGARGTGWGTLKPAAAFNNLEINATVSGLSGAITNAHLHNGAPGVSGGVIVAIPVATIVSDSALGVLASISASSDLIAILTSNTYVNIHTAANAGGEIRGQMLLNMMAMTVGISPVKQEDFQISCFPNPTTDVLNIRLGKDISATNGMATIFDNSGKMVAQYSLSLQQGIQTIELTQLATGNYVLAISADNQLITTKMVVKK